MMRSLYATVISSLLLLAFTSGCGSEGDSGAPGQAGVTGVMKPGGPPPSGGPGSNPAIKTAMEKLGKGPNSLTPTLGKELKETPPPWDAIQTQTTEYVKLTKAMISETPTRGDKESWTKLATAYADSAAELDKAVQAKDVQASTTAHGSLANSCMGCHRVHRAMMGPGGPGGPPPGGFGGPPPGGPGGPPPGGAPPK